LKFTSKEIDPTTGEPEESGYDDEYQVEDLELVGSDYVVPAFAGSFDHVWEQTGANGEEASETLQLDNVKGVSGKFMAVFIYCDSLFERPLSLIRCAKQMLLSNLLQLYLSSLLKAPTLPSITPPIL
jgi:hypothetical protein